MNTSALFPELGLLFTAGSLTFADLHRYIVDTAALLLLLIAVCRMIRDELRR
jgi:hypothetical protein